MVHPLRARSCSMAMFRSTYLETTPTPDHSGACMRCSGTWWTLASARCSTMATRRNMPNSTTMSSTTVWVMGKVCVYVVECQTL